MPEFKSPLTDADFAEMVNICARCDQRAPFIQTLSDLGIDTKGIDIQNQAQKDFCEACLRLHAEGRL